MARPTSSPGFTLIELMIVMAVIALLAAAAGPALGAMTGADARKSAGELAAAMRWLYDSAAVRHATCRLVLSPAERSYWAECAPGRTTIAGDPSKVNARPRAPEAGGGAANGFAAFDSPVVRRRELAGGANFTTIRVDGRDGTAAGREAYIHFFAGGRSQAARVTIADGDHVFTVRLEPFTGHARVIAGEPAERDE